jgi:dihydroceramidase
MPEGYFGPVTANYDWCEPNYVVTFYVAEFWNTMSNLPILASAMFGLYNCNRYGYGGRYALCYGTLAFTSVGSMLYHGTLTREGQVLDELPMIYTAGTFLFCVLEAPTSHMRARAWIARLLLVLGALFTGIYVLLPELFSVFLGAYLCAVALIIERSVAAIRAPSPSGSVAAKLASTHRGTQVRLLIACVAVYGFGFLIWNIENMYCGQMSPVFAYTGSWHAWFHLCSAFAPYAWIVFCTRANALGQQRPAALRWVGCVPYVTVAAPLRHHRLVVI